MSEKYLNSPVLRIHLTDSFIRRWLYLGYCLCGSCAVLRVFGAGYVPAALSLGLIEFVLLALCWRDPAAGVLLVWRGGQWYMAWGQGDLQPVSLNMPSAGLSGLLNVQWSVAAGARGSLWLFSDSAAPDQLRRLRVRLRLDSTV